MPTTFFSLSAELRNEISELASCELNSKDYMPEGQAANLPHRIDVPVAPPPLLQVNRQIRNEALGLYYGITTFSIDCYALNIAGLDDDEKTGICKEVAKTAVEWFESIGETGRKFVKRVEMMCSLEESMWSVKKEVELAMEEADLLDLLVGRVVDFGWLVAERRGNDLWYESMWNNDFE